ncbi:MAG: DUF1838 family protein [Pseudomonadota bacterium]|nr:DUF1838 family protein [Pseudomonadota bacterium]
MALKIQRRNFILGLGLASLMSHEKVNARVSGMVPNNIPDLTLPVNNVTSMLRMQATIGNEEQIPWHYTGILWAQKHSEQPIPMVKIEGMESYKVIPLDDGSYEILGNMVTFFRDVETGEMIDEYKNPFTGKTNKVEPNLRKATSIGRGLNISTMGIRPTSFIDQMPDKPLLIDWNFGADTVWMQNQTAYPPGLTPPRLQRFTMFSPLDKFVDQSILSLPTMFTATVLMPYLHWMDMDDEEGHTLWHASGVKLNDMSELPEEYSSRLMSEYSDYSYFDLTKDSGPVTYE